MGWERRDSKTYYYRGERIGTKVRKVYFGSGRAGRLAALDDERRREERRAAREKDEAESLLADLAGVEARRYEADCRLLLEAVMLSAGFRRSDRHKWRAWREGQKAIIAATTGAGANVTRTGRPRRPRQAG